MIKAVKFISIPVRDQDRSLAFYTDQLGFKVATDQPFDDQQRWIELKIPGAETLVVLFHMGPEWDGLIGKSMNFAFATDNVVRTYDELVAKGVVFEGPPQQMPWGTFAVLRDPDGTKIVLSSQQRSKA